MRNKEKQSTQRSLFPSAFSLDLYLTEKEEKERGHLKSVEKMPVFCSQHEVAICSGIRVP